MTDETGGNAGGLADAVSVEQKAARIEALVGRIVDTCQDESVAMTMIAMGYVMTWIGRNLSDDAVRVWIATLERALLRGKLQ